MALTLAAGLAACSKGDGGLGSAVLGATVASGSTTTTAGGTTPTSARAGTTTAARRTTTTGAAGAASPTTVAGACGAATRDPEPTIPGGLVTRSGSLGLRLAHPASWPLTDVSVAADQVLPRILLTETKIAPGAVLKPLVVRDRSNFPGLAVFRMPRPAGDLPATAALMRDFYFARRYQVQDRLLSACVDGATTVGLLATNGEFLQVTWVLYRDDSMYVIFGLAADDQTTRGQASAVADFTAVLQTIRWVG